LARLCQLHFAHVSRTTNPNSLETAPLNRYEGFNVNGAIVFRDRRGTLKADIPNVDVKSAGMMGDDSLAAYKPTAAKHVDATKAMGNFTGWTFASIIRAD
jgi:hypothetical protein